MNRTAVVLLSTVLLVNVLVAAPAQAACAPAGGAPWPAASAESQGDFVFSGKGFGHGVGMSQYGARGAAKLGCTSEQILSTYYTGVTVGQQPMPNSIRVGLIPNTPTNAPSTSDYIPQRDWDVTFTNTSSAPVPWLLDNVDIRTLGGPQQPAGATWRVELKASSTVAFYVIVSNGTEIWRSQAASSSPGSTLVAALDSKRVLDVAETGHEYRHGRLELYSTTSGMVLTANVGFEKYLYGLAEMPSSWEAEALEAQAIVGRSYAAVRVGGSWKSNCRCDLYDTVYDQAYTGYDKEDEGTDQVYGLRWVGAVNASAGVVIHSSGTILTGNYASSHGGHSDDVAFVWGGSRSHLRAVDDSNWEAASGNPYSTWTKRVTSDALGAAFGVGTALEVELPAPRGATGRIGNPARGAGGVRIIGTTGTVTVSGDLVRSRLGLRSTLFTVVNPTLGGTALTGDWDGDGDTELGFFQDGTFALRLDDGTVRRLSFGRAGDIPVVGDWNGNGTDGIGVVRGRTWFLRDTPTAGKANRTFEYGRVGDRPLPGNWDGVRGDEAGVLRDGTWHLGDRLNGGTARWSFHYGRLSAGDLPIVGDWNDEGRDRVGIVRNGEWHLRYVYAGGGADETFTYGRVTRGDVPVVGDWDKDGDDTPGVMRSGAWYLRNANSGGGADDRVVFRG